MPETETVHLIAQIIGFIGTIIAVIGMQQKQYKNIVICKISNEVLSSIHYLLLGGYTGMLANFASCLTNGCYYFRIKKAKARCRFKSCLLQCLC